MIQSISLLLRNSTRRQAVLKNTFWLALGIGFSGIGDFLLTVYVIRKFGAVEYGKFAYALSFVSLFSSVFDFGIATILVREFAGDRTKERFLSELVTLKTAIGVIGLSVVSIGGILVSHDVIVHKMIVTLGFYVVLVELANLFYALFRSRQRMELEAAFRVVYIVCLSVFVVGFTSIRPSILSLGMGYAGSIAVVLAGMVAFTQRLGKAEFSLRPSFTLSVWRDFAVAGLYIALAKAAGDVLNNTGAVILGHLGRVTEVGWYSAAAKINGMLVFPMGIVASSVFPVLVQARRSSPDQFLRYWRVWAKFMTILAFLLSSLIFVEAETIVKLVYHESFLPAAWTLRILVFAATLIYVGNLYYHPLLIFNRQREILYANLGAAIVNVVLNVLLAPRFGMYGVAVALVGTHAVLVSEYLVLTAKFTTIRPLAFEFVLTVLIGVFSGVLMNQVLSWMPARTVIYVAMPLGALLYLGSVGTLMHVLKRLYWQSASRFL